MSKNVAIVYWSGTGNTEEMARAVAAGVESAGVNVVSTVIANNAPDDEALEACSAAGRALVG